MKIAEMPREEMPRALPPAAVSQFGRNLRLTLLSKAVSVGSSVVFLALAARLFRMEEIAVVAWAAIGAALMDVCKGLGLGALLLRRLPKLDPSGPDAASLVLTYLVYAASIPAVLAGMLALAAGPIAEWFLKNPDQALDLRLGLACGFFTVLLNSAGAVFQARQQFGWLALETMASSVCLRLAPCLAALVFGLSFGRFLECSLLAAAAALLVCAPGLAPALAPAGRRLLRRGEFWGESRYFYWNCLLRYAATQLDQLLVAGLFTPAALAVYFMLRRVYSMAVMGIDGLLDTLTPDLSRQAGLDASAARARLQAWVRTALAMGAVGGAFLAGNGPWLLGGLLGAQYVSDTWLIALFAVSALAYLLFGLAQLDLLLFHTPRRILEFTAVTAAANLACGFFLGRLLGTRGLPLAMTLASFAGLALVRRSGSLGWQPLQAAGALTLILAAGMAPAAVSAEPFWLGPLLVNLLVAGVAFPLWLKQQRQFAGLPGRTSH